MTDATYRQYVLKLFHHHCWKINVYCCFGFPQTKNPFAVQPHLRKCFDAIAKLEFGSIFIPEVEKSEGFNEEVAPDIKSGVQTTDIVAMISPEGENVPLGKVKP